jgi:hypothetical protein
MTVQLLWPAPQVMPAPADAILCLGAGMAERHLPLPDDVTRGRALTCAALHAAGVAPVVVFTGAGNDTLSAAEAMAAVAAEAGMPPQAMIVEPRAHSTIQNAAFGLALLPEAPSGWCLSPTRSTCRAPGSSSACWEQRGEPLCHRGPLARRSPRASGGACGRPS